MQRTLRHLLVLATVICSRLELRADVVSVVATKDATIFSDGNGSHASGANKQLYSGLAGTNVSYPVRRALLQFDLAGSVPLGSTIQSVQLKLYMSQTVVAAKTFEVRRLSTQWNEGPTVGFGGGGGASVAGDVTWLHTNYPSQLWSTPGGDLAASASASASVGGTGFYTWGSNAALIADVQAWVNAPATNFGWALIGPETGAKSAKRFEARNSDVIAWRPTLTVTFTPPQPTTYCTSKTNSQGCLPAMGYSGTPDANAGSGFAVTASSVLNQKVGFLFYGTNGAMSNAFQGGTLCVQAPTKRTPLQNSGGNVGPDDCSGTFSLDFNARIASGVDATLVAGAQVWSQYWSRDPLDPFTTNLTNGLRFLIQP